MCGCKRREPCRLLRYAARYALFFAGIFFMAFGIALTTKANLGTTPISALPYVASLGLGASLGTFTMLLNMVLVLMQVLVMRRRFPRVQYLQIPASLLFGLFIDFSMATVPDIAGGGYGVQLAYLAAGTVVLAFGIFVEVSADVVMMAGEGAVMVLTPVTHRDFGMVKVAFDATLVVLATALSLLLFKDLHGVREGTAVSALCVGFVVKFFFALRDRARGKTSA